MNTCRKKRLIAMHLCSILFLTSLVAASARAQAPATAPVNEDPGDPTSASSFLPFFKLSFVPTGPRLMPVSRTRNIDQRVIDELVKAWCASADGTSGREGVVLIFRMADGSYKAKWLGVTNQDKRFTFTWNPAALAIVHTHPNSSDPRPSEQDRRVADNYGVPIFTITLSGMYLYDPAIKKTSKVLSGLDWLNPSTLSRWIQEMSRSIDRVLPTSGY